MRGEKLSTTDLFDEVSSGRRTAIGQLIVLYEPLLENWVRGYLGPRRFAREGDDIGDYEGEALGWRIRIRDPRKRTGRRSPRDP